MDTQSSTSRTEQGRFAPGCSGNPKGRPKGARSRTTLWDEALREGEAVRRVRQVLDDAEAGDGVALRFCVDRIEPRSRERYVEIRLGDGEERHPLIVFDAVTRALCGGKLSIGDALAIARFLSMREKVPSTWLAEEVEQDPVTSLTAAERGLDEKPPETPTAPAEPSEAEAMPDEARAEQAASPVSGEKPPVSGTSRPLQAFEERLAAEMDGWRRGPDDSASIDARNPME